MKLGEVIRKYRKEKQLTQEEMANILGVTAPAVNKWENGVSCPDISLLAPIARLLGISTDTLLSYREELTEKEVNQIVAEIAQKIKKEDYDMVFQWAMKKVQEYPNCESLVLAVAQVLDSYRQVFNVQEPEKYDKTIHELYERILQSKNQSLVQGALVALFSSCLSQKEYEQAQQYLDQIPKQGFNPNRFQAVLYKNQGKIEEAYELYEKLLFSGYGDISWDFQGLYSLAMEENNTPKAERMIKKQEMMAEILDMGEYMRVSPGLDLAVVKRDKEACFDILLKMVHSVKDMMSYQHSELYGHIKFSESMNMSNIAYMLKKGFEEDESIAFLRDDSRYDEVLEELKKIVEG